MASERASEAIRPKRESRKCFFKEGEKVGLKRVSSSSTTH